MNKKLLIIGSNTIHTYNYIDLIKDYFDEILLLTNKKNYDYDINSIEINFSLGINIISSIFKVRKIIKEFKPSIVHIHQANSYALIPILALKNRNIPKVLTAWGSDILMNPETSLLLKIIVKYILNNVDIVTADSNIVLTKAQSLVNKELNLSNVNFGIEVEKCINSKENIIYSNRLHKSLYNIDKIIISFSKFLITNKDWKLVIGATGSETENLKELCKKLNIQDNVEFIGWVNHKINFEYYCKSKIYVSIPSSDSVSLSLIEAIISGSIVFVSNLPANHEIVNSSIGFIENDKENIDFIKYLNINIEQFEEERKNIEKYFSKQFNKDKYIKIYNNLIVN